MRTIRDEIRIEAPAAKVRPALTTQAGYRGWWNNVAQVPPVGEATLRFDKGGTPVNMRFRMDEMGPEQVRWTCIGHDMPSWVGTTLNWLWQEEVGGTLVSFEHAGWREEAPSPVIEGWKHFLRSLKKYVETGSGEPW